MFLNKAVYRRLSNAFEYSCLSEIIQCFCFKAVLESVQCFLFIKKKSFVLEKEPLVEIPMVSFSLLA